ncbi:MAG TPA: ABC transporter ATP-binding protein [Trueperaceae bacterium]|jgi:ABC-type multidrug transport system fused ATPase/permease subunit
MTTRASTANRTAPAQASMLALLRRYLAPQRGMAALMALLLLAATGLQLLVPQILRRFIDGALTAAPGARLTSLALSFLAVAVVTQLLNAFATYVAASVGWRATNHLREDLTRHTLDLDMGFHNARTAGEMIERIDGDITSLSNFLSQFSVRVFGGLLLLVGILAALWVEEPLMGGALTAFVVLELVALTLTRRVGVPASNLEREANARQFGFIEERLQGLDDLRANGGGEYSLHRFRGVMRGVYLDTRRAWMLRSVVWLSSYGLFVIGLAVTVGSSIYLVRRGDMTVGAAYMVFQYLFMLQNPIEQITQQLQELQKAAAGVQRVGELFRTRSALPPGGDAELPAGPLSVAFEDVDFHYLDASADQLTLRGVTFRLAPGRRLGLLGRTGSGKTTLTRLVFRLYDPSGGRVRVGGVDTRDVDLQRLRARIGLVTQDVQLFRGTLRDNVTFFDPSVPDEVIVSVLEELGLGAWLRGQEKGLDTELDSGGRNLSAGEAQLIAFARVFLKDPGLVILDEPSSRLDPVTERRLEVALERLLHGRTAIVIAHRLETVERVDEIMVMERGRVVEAGPRVALAADPSSRYSRLRRAALALDLNVAGRAGETRLDPEEAELLEDLA